MTARGHRAKIKVKKMVLRIGFSDLTKEYSGRGGGCQQVERQTVEKPKLEMLFFLH